MTKLEGMLLLLVPGKLIKVRLLSLGPLARYNPPGTGSRGFYGSK